MAKNSNGEIKVDKGVPIPSGCSNQRYPWHAMEVGDSFLLTGPHGNVHSAAKQVGFAVKTRKVKGGLRVWRTA